MDIRNGGVQKGDLHGGAVGSHEVADETLGLGDLRPGAVDSLRGAQGPRGPQGPQGPRGPAGGSSSDDAPLLDTLSHLLYVEDGTRQMDTLTYRLKDPIKFEDLDLTFFQELVHEGAPGASAVGASVILGVDANDDGKYEAKDLAWHVGETPHDPALLKDDTFVEMDGASPSVFSVFAPDEPRWWSPNVAGDGFNTVDPNCYNTLAVLVADWADVRFDADDKIEVVRLVLGGSGAWNDVAYRLTTRSIGAEVKELKHVSIERLIPIPPAG